MAVRIRPRRAIVCAGIGLLLLALSPHAAHAFGGEPRRPALFPAAPSASLVVRAPAPGAGLEGARLRLRVFSLEGKLVYDSGFREGMTVQWNLQTQSGAVAANGIYLFVLTTRDREGRLFHRLGRVVVLR